MEPRQPSDTWLIPETTFRLSEDTYLEPDIVVFPRSVGVAGLNGRTALLVVEFGDSSLAFDMGPKAALYAGFGVRELWVINAVKLTTRVFRGPTPKGYGDVRDCAGSDRITPLFAAPELALRLDELELA